MLSLFYASGLRSLQGSDLEYPLRIETIEWSHWDSRVYGLVMTPEFFVDPQTTTKQDLPLAAWSRPPLVS